MKAFNFILGLFSVLGAIYCMFFPGVTFLNTGWIVAMLLGVYGICSIFEYCSNPERKQKKSGGLITGGVLGLILGIASAVLSVIALFSAGARAILDITILYMFAFWLVYSGFTSMYASFAQKKKGGKMWILTLLLGFVVIFTGFYGAIHPLFTAFSIGYLIGIELMIYGIRLVMSLFEKSE